MGFGGVTGSDTKSFAAGISAGFSSSTLFFGVPMDFLQHTQSQNERDQIDISDFDLVFFSAQLLGFGFCFQP